MIPLKEGMKTEGIMSEREGKDRVTLWITLMSSIRVFLSGE
jgi:hypothetical protein